MTSPRLTAPQRALLERFRASDTLLIPLQYPPRRKLAVLGLIEQADGMMWRVTQAGRDLLGAKDATNAS